MIDVLAFLFAMALTVVTAYLTFIRGLTDLARWSPVLVVVSLFVMSLGIAASYTSYMALGQACTAYPNGTQVCVPVKVIMDPHGFGLVAFIVGLAHLIFYGALVAFYPLSKRGLWRW